MNTCIIYSIIVIFIRLENFLPLLSGQKAPKVIKCVFLSKRKFDLHAMVTITVIVTLRITETLLMTTTVVNE